MHIIPDRKDNEPEQHTGLLTQPWIPPFLNYLQGQNLSSETLRAYRVDLAQCFAIVTELNGTLRSALQLTRGDLEDYLAELARRRLTGASRAGKLAAGG